MIEIKYTLVWTDLLFFVKYIFIYFADTYRAMEPPKWGGNITDFTQDIENIPWDAKWTKSYPDDLVKLCSDVLNKYYIVAEAGIARADARYYHMNAVDALLGRKNVGLPRDGVSRPGPLVVITAADFLDEFPKYKELIDDPIVVEARASVKAYADSLKR